MEDYIENHVRKTILVIKRKRDQRKARLEMRRPGRRLLLILSIIAA